MTPICITGSAPLLPATFAALQPLGLSPAKPLARDPKVTLHTWHQRVVAAGDPQPSRVWQQLAADLLLDNIDAPQWAWADEHSLHLLDFWAGFDASVRFVLLADTPAQALLRQRHLGNTTQLLSQWAGKHQTMLRFALRHPERCLLVWGQQAELEPQALAQKMAQRWALSLSAKPQPPRELPDPCALAEHLAQHLCNQHPQVQQLLSDLQACVEPLGQPHTHSFAADPSQLLARYQTLADRSAEATQVAGLQKELKAAQEQAKAQQDQLGKSAEQLKAAQAKAADTDKALATAKAELGKAQEQLKAAQAKAAEADRLATQLKDSGAEAELLLNQLHTVQEELETYYLRNQDLQAQVAKVADADKARTAAQAELAKTQAALKTAQDQLKAAQDQAAKTAAELKAATAKTADVDKARAAAQAELDKTRPLLKEAQDEAELLLNQLHVVQEELENYYYRNKELQAQAQAHSALQQRWNQLFAANPHLYASDDVAFALNADGSVGCTVSGLHMAGRHFAQLHATLALEADGTLALQLPRAADGGPLLRWPGQVATGAALSLNPSVGASTPPARIATYMQLSSSDWQLAQHLPRLLLAAVQAGPAVLSAPQQAALAQALQQHEQALVAFKRMLRFDQAQLAEPASAEHLHITLQHASHDGISAANLALQLHTTPSGVRLQLGASALLGNTEPLTLHLDTQGWRQPEQAPLNDAQRLRINALLAVLPLALMDTVAQGANKDSLAPWGKLAPQLRAWSQLSHTPAPAVAPVAPTKKAPRKAPAKTATKAASTTTKAAPATKTAKAPAPAAKAADQPRTKPRRKAAA